MLGLAARLSKFLAPARRSRSRPVANRRGGRLACEGLEPRELLSGPGADYTLMGGQWDNSRPITFSIAPDGVNWDVATNNVNASLNAEYGGPGWQAMVARALQTWSAATNLNFTQVGDGAEDFNAQGLAQGDPRFGDIRVGGYNFGTTSTIARTYGPPPNGQTGAGDVELNTGFNFGPGSHYDLQSVLIHELGHSLGLGESPQPSSVMYSYYAGVRQALSPYDVEGIQSLYGPRLPDAYQGQGLATSPSTALDLTPLINPLGQGAIAGLGLQTIGDVEYFSVVAPQAAGAMLQVAAVAQGFSLLSAKISVIDPSTGATLAANANPNAYGDVAQVSVPGVQAGHRYLIAVTGATSDVFAVGSYGIAFGFFGGTPTTPPPDPFAYNNTFATATDLGVNTQPTLLNLTLPSALNYQVFTFQATNPGLVLVGTLGAEAIVVNSTGRNVVAGSGLLGFNSGPGPNRYFLILLSPSGTSVSNYAFAVRTPTRSGFGGNAITPTSPSTSRTPSVSPTPNVVDVASVGSSRVGADVVAGASAPTGPLRKPSRPKQ